MTNEKAREYFSAYSEGTLDAGLAHSFEAKLNADSSLKLEFDQFEATLKELELLRYEQVEVPFDLNDRIGAAIDRNLYEKKHAAQPKWMFWLRNAAFAGLAAAAVFGAYVSINAGANGGPIEAGPGLSPRPSATIEQIEYSRNEKGVHMKYQPSTPHSVTVKGGSEGEKKFEVGRNGWLNELENSQPAAASFSIDVEGETPATVVVVPGTERISSSTGHGSLVEFAKAIANKYGVPVVIKSSKTAGEVSWDLADPDALKAAQTALQTSFAVDLRDGIVTIGDA